MVMPPVPKAITPQSLIPGPIDLPGLKALHQPVAGTFGPSGVLENLGAKVEGAVKPAMENIATNNPLAKAAPTTNAALMTLPSVAVDMTAPAFRPSSVQQQIGAEGMGIAANAPLPVIGKSVKDLGKGVLTKYGKTVHGFEPEATEQAIKNPKVMNKDFAGADKFESITKGLKRQLDNVQRKISEAYDALKSKLDKPNKKTGAVGKVRMEDVTEPLEKTKTELKIDKPGISKVEDADAARFKKFEQEIYEQTDVKGLEDRLAKRPKNNKLTAEQMLEIRQRLDREIDYEGNSTFYNSKLKGLRKNLDELIREKYPDIKKLDAEVSQVKRAQATIKRRTGIQAGKETTNADAEKVERMSRYLFGPGRTSLRKGITEAGNKVGAGGVVNDLKDVSAAAVFDSQKDPLVQLFGVGLNPRALAKGLFKGAIRGSKAGSRMLGKSLPAIGTVAPGYVKKKKNEK
jgi:hypothetical protein